MNIEELETESVRAAVRHLSAREGLHFAERGRQGDGFQAVLTGEEEAGDVFFATAPGGGTYLSLSLILVVDEEFFRDNSFSILDVLSRYEVCPGLTRDETLSDGEVYLNLSIRVFLDGLNGSVFRLAIANLGAARDALAESFP